MRATGPEPKPHPADPLSNPPPVPQATVPDEPMPLPNQPPRMPPVGVLTPGCPPIQLDHRLGPRDAVERARVQQGR